MPSWRVRKKDKLFKKSRDTHIVKISFSLTVKTDRITKLKISKTYERYIVNF
jgi:uncharacterized protein with FMN-binding domain